MKTYFKIAALTLLTIFWIGVAAPFLISQRDYVAVMIGALTSIFVMPTILVYGIQHIVKEIHNGQKTKKV